MYISAMPGWPVPMGQHGPVLTKKQKPARNSQIMLKSFGAFQECGYERYSIGKTRGRER